MYKRQVNNTGSHKIVSGLELKIILGGTTTQILSFIEQASEKLGSEIITKNLELTETVAVGSVSYTHLTLPTSDLV